MSPHETKIHPAHSAGGRSSTPLPLPAVYLLQMGLLSHGACGTLKLCGWLPTLWVTGISLARAIYMLIMKCHSFGSAVKYNW